MSHVTEERTPSESRESPVPAAGLAATVLSILVMGLVLHARVPEPEGTMERIAVPVRSAVAPAERTPVEPAVPSSDLPARATRDAARLAASLASGGGAWTLQILAACRVETLREPLLGARGQAGVYVVPYDDQGRACHRLLWGEFGSKEEALAAAVPAPLHTGADPVPRRIAEVLP